MFEQIQKSNDKIRKILKTLKIKKVKKYLRQHLSIYVVKTNGSRNSLDFLKNRRYPKTPCTLILGLRHLGFRGGPGGGSPPRWVRTFKLSGTSGSEKTHICIWGQHSTQKDADATIHHEIA